MIQASISKVQHYGFDPAASLRSERMPAGAPQRSVKSEEKQEGCGALPQSTDPKKASALVFPGHLPAVQSESFKSSASYIYRGGRRCLTWRPPVEQAGVKY